MSKTATPSSSLRLSDLRVVLHFAAGIGIGILLPALLVTAARYSPETFTFNPTLASTELLPPQSGHELYLSNCASCHGVRGQGQPNWGSPLVSSRFIRNTGDDALLAFLKRGRTPNDPQSVMKGNMPPRGGNPRLTDRDLKVLVDHMREMTSATTSVTPGH